MIEKIKKMLSRVIFQSQEFMNEEVFMYNPDNHVNKLHLAHNDRTFEITIKEVK